jgi:hypothetical protein
MTSLYGVVMERGGFTVARADLARALQVKLVSGHELKLSVGAGQRYETSMEKAGLCSVTGTDGRAVRPRGAQPKSGCPRLALRNVRS